MSYPVKQLSLTEFLHSNLTGDRYEFFDGMVSHKLLPPYNVENEMDRDPKPFRSSNFTSLAQ